MCNIRPKLYGIFNFLFFIFFDTSITTHTTSTTFKGLLYKYVLNVLTYITYSEP